MFQFVLMGVAIPAAIGAAGLLAAAWLARRGALRASAAAIGAAFAVTFVLSFAFNEGWRGLALRSLWHWIVPIVAAGAVIGIVAAFLPRRGWITVAAALAIGAAAAILLHPPPAVEQPWLWRGLLGGAVIGLFLLLQPLAGTASKERRHVSILLSVGGLITFSASSAVLMQSYNSKLAFMSGAMAAACGSAAVLSLLSRAMRFDRAAIAVMASSLGGLLVIGRLWDQADLPALSFLLVGASPLALWLSEAPPLRRRRWLGVAAALAAVAAIAGGGAALTFTAEAPPPYEYEY